MKVRGGKGALTLESEGGGDVAASLISWGDTFDSTEVLGCVRQSVAKFLMTGRI